MKKYIINLYDYKAITMDNPDPLHISQALHIMAYEADIETICDLMSRYKIVKGIRIDEIKAVATLEQ